MKTIGMIGGMSWESTAVYYRTANQLVREHLGGLHSAKIVLASVDFHETNALQKADDWATAGEVLAQHARNLQASGADMILICTNTMHLVYEAVQAAVSVPVIHLADVTAEAIRRQQLDRVGLLGTAFTMEKPFYRDRVASHGIEVLVPEADDRVTIHDAIFDELTRGIVRDDTRARVTEIIQRLAAQGAEGIILGCTELELLISEADSPVPVFPTATLHVEAAVKQALADGATGT